MKKYIFCLLLAGCAAAIPDEPTKRIEFMAAEAYPEGIAFDSIANVFYVSSERLGTIGKVSIDGKYTPLYDKNDLKSTYGLKVHPDGKRIFVCAADANYSKFTSPETRKKMGRLIGIDIATGKKVDDIDLSGLVSGKHFPNDLTFDDKRNAYVTDSFANVIYKVTPEGKATVFADSPLFKTEGVGLNGIVWNKGGFLLVINSGTGVIYKIDVNDPTKVFKVANDQYFMNGDGLLLMDSNTMVVVQNGGSDKIYKLTSEDNWATSKLAATTLAADRFTYPTTATRIKEDVWVINARTSELVDSTSVPSQKFAMQHARFLPIPKK